MAAFAEFWQNYPRKVSKRHALKAWLAATKRAEPSEILAGLAQATFPDDGKFIPHPATWLNGDRWLDEAEESERQALMRAVGIFDDEPARPSQPALRLVQ